MPKKGKQLEDFSGGVNTYADPQNIADNELAHCSGFKSELGEIVVLGDMKAVYTIGSGDTAAGENIDIEAGYGLFAFSADYDQDGDLASTNYFALQVGHRISIYDDVDHTWPVIVDDTIAFADDNPDRITDSGNRFVTAGFKSGMKILVSGSGAAGNNTYHTIASVAAGALTLTDDSSLTARGAIPDETVTIVGIHIDLGTSHSSNAMASFKPCFFFVDGALRVSPGNFDKVDAGSETDAVESTPPLFDQIGRLALIQADDTSKVEAGDIAVIDGLEYFIVVATGTAPTEHMAVRNTTGMFPSKFANASTIYVMPDTKWRGIVQRRCFPNLTAAGTFTEWYTCPMSPKPPTSDPGTDDMDDRLMVEMPFICTWATGNFSAADGYHSGNVVIGTNEEEANVNGSWDTTIRLWITALYDDVRQESQPFRIHHSTTETIAAGYELGVNVVVQYSDDGAPAYTLNKRVVGARLYYEDIVDDLGVLYQLLDIDFEMGCKKAESESYTGWVERTANRDAICPTAITAHGSRTGTNAFTWAAPPKAFTYEINTGYPVTTNIHARFKTAVIANRRLYVGNVYQGGKAYGDRILYSPVNKFDILPEINALPLAIGDGDEIIKLATFADRLLSFKKRTLYIINIGSGALSAFIESQHSNMGVENPCQVCDTEYGPAWVNKFGVFLYDGQKINELTRGKLQISNSTRGLGLNIVESLSPLIGYHPLNKWIVVHVSSEVSGSYETEAWIFDFKNGSWAWSQEFTAQTTADPPVAVADFKTNMVNTHDNELVFAAGTNSSDTPDFFKLQGSTNAITAAKLFLLTKDFTLNIPSVKKNVYGIVITYSAGASTAIQAELIYKTATGSTTVTTTSSSALYHDTNGFQSTSNAKATIELTPASAIKGAHSVQLKLYNQDATYQAADLFKLYNITFIYRDKSLR